MASGSDQGEQNKYVKPTEPQGSACLPRMPGGNQRFAYPNIGHLTTNGKDEPEAGSRMEDGLGEPGAGGEEGGREEEEDELDEPDTNTTRTARTYKQDEHHKHAPRRKGI